MMYRMQMLYRLQRWRSTFNACVCAADCHLTAACVCAPRFDISDKGLPFFVFFYIDEHIAVAKGRGGGWAYWRRMDPVEELKYGIV